jgi:hypothetical protein
MTDDCAFARHGGGYGAMPLGWWWRGTAPRGVPAADAMRLDAEYRARRNRLQPNQLAWCAANVPGFVDLLAPTTGIYEEAQC